MFNIYRKINIDTKKQTNCILVIRSILDKFFDIDIKK